MKSPACRADQAAGRAGLTRPTSGPIEPEGQTCLPARQTWLTEAPDRAVRADSVTCPRRQSYLAEGLISARKQFPFDASADAPADTAAVASAGDVSSTRNAWRVARG